MSKFNRSWSLFKSSLTVIRQNKILLIFPIAIAICTMFILAFFLVPVTFQPTGHSYASSEHWAAIEHSLFPAPPADQAEDARPTMTGLGQLYMVFMYFVAMVTATFLNLAFFHEILAALRGQSVSIRRGFQFAITRWKAVLMWALFAGLVGLIIRSIEQRFGFIGRIIVGFIGLAWSVTTVFVIPGIVMDEQNDNPLKMLRNSANILKRTWGEALIGYVGISLFGWASLLASMAILVVAAVASAMLHTMWLLNAVVMLWLVAMIMLVYLTNVASQVFKGALYLYADTGIISSPFSKELLDSAWKQKKQ